MNDLERLLQEVGGEYAPDARTSVFEVAVAEGALTGQTTVGEAVEALLALLSEAGTPLRDDVVRLPDPLLAGRRCALVTSPYAPVHARPAVTATQTTQYVLGARLDVLTMRDGWLHPGYLETGDEAWAREWETGSAGESLVSLDAEVHDEAGRTIARLPWGARVIRDQPRSIRLPDGRHGVQGAGELIPLARRSDRFPARGDSVVRSAREWLGVPYLWGGVTQAGVDCSGLVQSVLWMHGIALPRDSDMQALVGEAVEPDPAELLPGDLVFFAENDAPVTHVALSMGAGEIIHSALANGEVAVNDLRADRDVDRRLAAMLCGVRRVLPD